jgi:hypothetical protein
VSISNHHISFKIGLRKEPSAPAIPQVAAPTEKEVERAGEGKTVETSCTLFVSGGKGDHRAQAMISVTKDAVFVVGKCGVRDGMGADEEDEEGMENGLTQYNFELRLARSGEVKMDEQRDHDYKLYQVPKADWFSPAYVHGISILLEYEGKRREAVLGLFERLAAGFSDHNEPILGKILKTLAKDFGECTVTEKEVEHAKVSEMSLGDYNAILKEFSSR